MKSVKLFELGVEGHGDAEAMVRLCDMQIRRAEVVRTNAGRGAELYERAIQMRQDHDAMLGMTLLLRDGGDGFCDGCRESFEAVVVRNAGAWRRRGNGASSQPGAGRSYYSQYVTEGRRGIGVG